jgi:hypothetical protein
VYADFAGTLVIDEADEALATEVQKQEMQCVIAPTVMHTIEHAEELARRTLASSAGATR